MRTKSKTRSKNGDRVKAVSIRFSDAHYKKLLEYAEGKRLPLATTARNIILDFLRV